MSSDSQPAAVASVVSLVDAVCSRYGSSDDTAYEADAFLVGDKSRRKNKTWEMVGMEKTRVKQSHHQNISNLGLSDCTISVGQKSEDEIKNAKLLRVAELDLTNNSSLTITEVDIIVRELPKSLTFLQLSQIPLFQQPLAAPGSLSLPVTWPNIKKLVLNSTQFVHLGQLQDLIYLPLLEELHLDNNCIERLQFNDAVGGRPLQTVTTLSLGGNKFTDWKSSGIHLALHSIFPACTKLLLTNNDFPDLPFPIDSAADEAFATILASTFSRLVMLCLNENKRFIATSNLQAVRSLCPSLDTFRVTYPYMFPKISETHARMMVVASLPSINMLNRGHVRAKERLDSELFYVQRGLAETDEASQLASFPFTMELREKHKDVVLSLRKEGDTASSCGTHHVMLSVDLCCDGCLGVTKVIPSSLTIGKLKALVRTCFGIEAHNQVLGFYNADQAKVTAATPLDNELQTLGYFGVGTGALIKVQDMSVRTRAK